jgi:hypothetical protein
MPKLDRKEKEIIMQQQLKNDTHNLDAVLYGNHSMINKNPASQEMRNDTHNSDAELYSNH